jgi:hypothetical protein
MNRDHRVKVGEREITEESRTDQSGSGNKVQTHLYADAGMSHCGQPREPPCEVQVILREGK